MPFYHELVHIATLKVFGQQHRICLPIAFEVLMFFSRLLKIIKVLVELQITSTDF